MFGKQEQLGDFLTRNGLLSRSEFGRTCSYRNIFFLETAQHEVLKIQEDSGSTARAEARGESLAEAAECFLRKFAGQNLVTDSGRHILLPGRLRVGAPWKG